MSDKLFVSQTISCELLKKGFPRDCLAYWIKDTIHWKIISTKDLCDLYTEKTCSDKVEKEEFTPAFTYDQVRNWFEEKHDIQITYIKGHKPGSTEIVYYPIFDRPCALDLSEISCKTLQEALELAILEAIKII